MRTKSTLMELIEREEKFCKDQQVGSEAYKDSFYRLLDLKKELEALENSEFEHERKEREMIENKKDRRVKNVIEITKVVSGFALPLIGYVAVTAFEKEDTFTSALKGVVNCFIPKKL